MYISVLISQMKFSYDDRLGTTVLRLFFTVRVKVVLLSFSSVVVPSMASGTLKRRQINSHSSSKLLRYSWGIEGTSDVKVPQRHAQNDDHLAAISFAEFIEACSFFYFLPQTIPRDRIVACKM